MKTGDLKVLSDATNYTSLLWSGHRWFHVAVYIGCRWWTVRVHYIDENIVECITVFNWHLWETKRVRHHPDGSIPLRRRDEETIRSTVHGYAKIIPIAPWGKVFPAGNCALLINTFLK